MEDKRCGTCALFTLERPEGVAWGHCDIWPSTAPRPFWYTPRQVHGGMQGGNCPAWASAALLEAWRAEANDGR